MGCGASNSIAFAAHKNCQEVHVGTQEPSGPVGGSSCGLDPAINTSTAPDQVGNDEACSDVNDVAEVEGLANYKTQDVDSSALGNLKYRSFSESDPDGQVLNHVEMAYPRTKEHDYLEKEGKGLEGVQQKISDTPDTVHSCQELSGKGNHRINSHSADNAYPKLSYTDIQHERSLPSIPQNKTAGLDVVDGQLTSKTTYQRDSREGSCDQLSVSTSRSTSAQDVNLQAPAALGVGHSLSQCYAIQQLQFQLGLIAEITVLPKNT